MAKHKSQQQTKSTFGFKWKKIESYDSDNMKYFSYKWLLSRYFGTENNKKIFFRKLSGKSLLDAGCGSAYSARIIFKDFINRVDYTGVDISADALRIAKKFFKTEKYNGNFIVGNIQNIKLKSKYDLIFSEGVLHHTSDPYKSFKNLLSHLKPGGIIMFYIYRKKSALREYTDDYVRERLKNMNNDDAWNALKPLTQLGIEIGKIKTKLRINNDIKLLGIKSGTYDLQRFFYYNICKAFYDPNLSFEELNHINFDWYRPLNCFRFSEDEIRSWLIKNNLRLMRFVSEESGITVVAKKS